MTTDDSSGAVRDRRHRRRRSRRAVLGACGAVLTAGCLRSQTTGGNGSGPGTDASAAGSDTEDSRTDSAGDEGGKGEPGALSEKWAVDPPNTVPVFSPSGDIVVCASDRGVHSVAAADGEVRWSRETEPIRTRPAVTGDTVFAPSAEGTLYALSREDGAVRWTFTGEKGLTTVPICRPELDRVVVGAGTSEGTTVGSVAGDSEFDATYLYGLSLEGERAWTVETAGGNPVSSVALFDDTLYLRTVNLLAAYDPVDGSEREWDPDRSELMWDRPNLVRYHTKRLFADDQGLYVPTRDGVASVDHDGNHRWSFEPYDSPTRFGYDDGTAYLGAEDNAVYAVDGADGSERWRVQLDGTITDLGLNDGTLWGSDDAGTVVALDGESGDSLVESETDDGTYSLAVAAGTDRLVRSTSRNTTGWRIERQ